MSTCVLPHRHDPDRARRALDGMFVCAGCLHRVEQAIAELPSQHDALERRLAPGAGSGRGAPGASSWALPIVPVIADHREDIARKLASWALMVSEERGMHPPASSRPTATAPWLLVHLRWACAQPWVDDLAGEMTALRSRSFSLLFPTSRRRVPVGPCPLEDCTGTLTASIGPADDLLPPWIGCDHEPEHLWSPSQWHHLGRSLGRPMVHAQLRTLLDTLTLS
jgi:hypothetical protein